MKRRNARCPICRDSHAFPGGDPESVLRRTPATLARELRRAPRRLLARRPARGAWAVNEVVAHLADAEIALAFRVRKIAAERNPVLNAWDQDAWAEGLRYRASSPTAGLAAFRAFRRANLDVLARVGRGRRTRSGRHPEYGKVTLGQLLAHIAHHDLTHVRQIRQTLVGRR